MGQTTRQQYKQYFQTILAQNQTTKKTKTNNYFQTILVENQKTNKHMGK